jgi:hypothetical protein
MRWGVITGLAIGSWVSYNYIFPDAVLGTRLADITIGDILRIVGGLIITFVAVVIGHFIDIGRGAAD